MSPRLKAIGSILSAVVVFLTLGVGAAISHGLIPKTIGQLLIIALIFGPLILFSELAFQLLGYAIGYPICWLLRHVPHLKRHVPANDDEGVVGVGLVTLLLTGFAVAYWYFNHNE